MDSGPPAVCCMCVCILSLRAPETCWWGPRLRHFLGKPPYWGAWRRPFLHVDLVPLLSCPSPPPSPLRVGPPRGGRRLWFGPPLGWDASLSAEELAAPFCLLACMGAVSESSLASLSGWLSSFTTPARSRVICLAESPRVPRDAQQPSWWALDALVDCLQALRFSEKLLGTQVALVKCVVPRRVWHPRPSPFGGGGGRVSRCRSPDPDSPQPCWADRVGPPVMRFPGGIEAACQCRRHRFDPWVRRIPWRREWQATPGFLPGKFLQRSLEGYRPQGRKESGVTERLNSNSLL